uniref:Uncharacterized protein n=1 Tax=Timema poppense TaxID=170557 RepID=A0A7R9DCH9_TIMPO|nr:unnamed protein product [Timema poppensis]
MEINIPSPTCETQAEQDSPDNNIKKEIKLESESEPGVPTSNQLQMLLPASSVEKSVIGVPTSLAQTPSCATNNLLQPQGPKGASLLQNPCQSSRIAEELTTLFPIPSFINPQELSTTPAHKIGSRAPLSGGKLRTKLEPNIAHRPKELEIRLQKARSKIEYQKRLHQLNLKHQTEMFRLEVKKQLKTNALRLQILRERCLVKMAFDSQVKQYQLAVQQESYKLKRHLIRLERKQAECKPPDFANVPIKSEAQEVCEPSPCCSVIPIKQTQELESESAQVNCPIKSEFADNECLKATPTFPSSGFPIISEEAVVQ